MANVPGDTAHSERRQRRQFRNYLLDRRFQLKYAAYFAGIALGLSVVLGLILYATAHELLMQSRRTIENGRAVIAEGRKVSDVVEMSIVRDPDYQADPGLLRAFREGDKKYSEKLAREQQVLEAQYASLERQYLESTKVLLFALGLFVVLVGLAGILVTHRVAGPIHKMKRLMGEVSQGRLHEPGKLRRRDELVDFFVAFEGMVRALRHQRAAELEELGQAIARLEGKVAPDDLAALLSLRDRVRSILDS